MSIGRSLQLSNFDWIGFDLDHTLIRYNVPALDKLVCDTFAQYLVNHRNYPTKLLNSYRPDPVYKGLIVHLKTGDIIKLDANKNIVCAYHGSKQLTKEEINKKYTLPLHDFHGKHEGDYWLMPTFFERGVGPLWHDIIDVVDTWKGGIQETYKLFYDDIQLAIRHNFADYPNGYFFPLLRDHPEKYLFTRYDVADWLKKLRSGSETCKPVKLFLLTNSLPNFTKLLCDFAFGPDWRSLFDLILFHGRKPNFWVQNPPVKFEWLKLNSNGEFVIIDDNVKELQHGEMYQFGNGTVLQQFISKTHTGEGEPRVCYIGDHIVSDCLECKTHMKWSTIAIVEELEHITGETLALTDLAADKHPMWESFFSGFVDTDEASLSFWAKMIVDGSDFVIPCLSALVDLPTDYLHKNSENHLLSPVPVHLPPKPTTSLYYKSNSLAR